MGHEDPSSKTQVGAEFRKAGYAGGAEQQPAEWRTHSTSPEAKIPPGQFIPGDFTSPVHKTHHSDPDRGKALSLGQTRRR